ncbi:glutaminase family protein [Lewinella sp. IMCC34183]|uniref:glutaminase family protein n=1 Tax=Lewinella sp. IMCC34183 TaxID=2248762 RepID=UPI000E24DB14|nr:glutaminase family protein [Lewinella sp. IMCC34183]
MRYFLLLILATCTLLDSAAQNRRQAPAYPLVVHDPYFSIWAMDDDITASSTAHWTGAPHGLLGLIKVDGIPYRFLGKEAVTYRDVVPSSETGRFSETNPGDGWQAADFDDGSWRTATAPFGDAGRAKTTWTTDDIWFRKTFDLPARALEEPYLKLSHDDDVKAYLNGQLLYECEECWTDPDKFKYFRIPEEALKTLQKRGNVLAVHVRNNRGGQWLNAGIVDLVKPAAAPEPARQTALNLTATQTSYDLTCGGVDLTLTFTSPLLLDDLDLLSRPVSYLSVKASANDDRDHRVQVWFGASSQIATHDAGQEMVAEAGAAGELGYLKVGTREQPVLEKKGDILGIDWGYLYVATPKAAGAKQRVVSGEQVVGNFIVGKRGASERTGKQLMLTTVFPEERVRKEKEYLILLGYDDRYSINFFGEQLRPWWNKDGNNSLPGELEQAYRDYATVVERCEAFDAQLRQDGEAAGGAAYAELLEIGYRQSIAAHKLVESPAGELLFLSKENNSNGSINTVDVTYPSAPLFLAYNPDLLKGMLNGIFYYSESGKWKKPFPAHDLGTYPIATGQTYGEDMPIEEAGNMVVLTAAIAKAEGNADYAAKHWESLTQWADYLAEEGLDPANQLSTDDFSGHLARNANLSVKAIVGVGGYGYLAAQLGKDDVARTYTERARTMARQWMELADAGDHYVLAFDNPDTWSQKYNLVWDKLIGLDLFPQQVYDTELAYYATKNNAYGLPLDNRSDYSKSDWILWTATLTDSQEDFREFADPVYKFALETKDRVPMSDWHWTSSGDQRGFKARSVVGGYFIKLMADKWASAR